jgi:hypothetical protein
MKKSIFSKNTKYWITAFEYNQYLEFKKYLEEDNDNKKYLTYYNYFAHIKKDYLILYCRPVPKKIKGGIFGYLILNDKSEANDINGNHIKVFKDDLVNRCYSEIDEYILNDEFLNVKNLVENLGTTEKSFSIRYIKKFLKMENIPSNIGEHIIKELDKENEKEFKDKKLKEKELEKVSNKSESDIDDSDSDCNSDLDNNETILEESSISNEYESDKESDSLEENDDTEDDKSNNTKSESEIENLEDDDNKNGSIPIMVELCKRFKFPNLKYDKKKYSILKNPDIDEKIKYFKKHMIDCEKCNIINNNNRELSNYIITSKISLQEHLKVKFDLEEGIEKYQNSQKYDAFGYDLNENNMKINYINDNENIYKNCLLIYITLKTEE